jgi:hypothetical protein
MNEHFKEDTQIQKIAELYAHDAIDFGRDKFNLELDWTDESVAHIESMLSVFHEQKTSVQPTEEQILLFSKIFGSYIGEVFRRNHGATWGIISLEGNTIIGLSAHGKAGLFWPWGRTQNRINNGSEDNVWHYYQALVQRNVAVNKAFSFSIFERVSHAIFGEGVIQELGGEGEDERVKVVFNNGDIKWLVIKYAQLKRL